MTRDETLERYRQYRKACTAIQTAAFRCVPSVVLTDTAKRLGLWDGKRIIAESDDDLVLVYDLAVHTARRGRSRAIDRYAKSHADLTGADGIVLAALRDARFSLFRVVGGHPETGLMVEDVMRGGETWLVDVNLEATATPGAVLAMRLARPDAFAIGCGTALPIDDETLDELLDYLTDDGDDDLSAVADHPLFAESVYRLALETGLTDLVGYR